MLTHSSMTITVFFLSVNRKLPQTIADIERWTLTVSPQEKEAYQRELKEQIAQAKKTWKIAHSS